MGEAEGQSRQEPATGGGPLAPFQHRAFRVLWVATVISNVGTWVHEVAAGWLMTSLAPSPLLVALVQTATTLPMFLFALPAGALADILDRRRLLIGVQLASAGVAGGLGLLVLSGQVTPWTLLALTFLAGTGAALIRPTWQAIVPRLVSRRDLQSAIALDSMGINISRAVGPALGGAVIALAGYAAPFWLNTLTFLAVVAALLWWRDPHRATSQLPAERFWAAIASGLRFTRASPALRATLARALAFFAFASAYWALMPLIARQRLDGGPTLYGVLLGAIGAGAVAGAFALPWLKKRLGPNRLVVLATLGTALVLVIFAVSIDRYAAVAAGALAGACWIAVLSSLNVSAQLALPEWVRGRGLSVFVTVFFGAMSGGSLVWGQVANAFDIPTALLAAAAGAVVLIPVSLRWRLQQGEGLDLSPSMHWPTPAVADDVTDDQGPVMVTIEYRIDPEHGDRFTALLHELAASRRQTGAFAWGLFRDAAEPGRYLEYFMVESWLAHLRQHERVTTADRHVQDSARPFHIGENEPVVTHYIATGSQHT
jgi:MFS family permease